MRKLQLLIALTAVLAAPAPGGTAGAEGQNANGTTNDSGAEVVVVVPGSSSGGYTSPGYKRGGRSSSNIECAFFATSVNTGAEMPGVGTRVTDTSTIEVGTYLWLECRDASSGNITFQNVFAWDPADPPVATPTAEVLAQMAANSMRLPTPAAMTWPPSGGKGLVNLPVWLHVDNWEPISASATAGGLTATVEAVPVRAEWDMDEGTVTCTDAGSAYDPSLRPDPSSSSCSYTYRRSSGSRPDLTFRNSVVVVWRLRWFATNGQGGDLGELSGPAADFGLQIEESQALVAGTGD